MAEKKTAGATKAPARARKPRARKAKAKAKAKVPELYDWLESLVAADKAGTISDAGKVALKRYRAKAKEGSTANATALKIAEQAVKT